LNFLSNAHSWFYARSQNCEKRLLASHDRPSVRPSSRMKRLGLQWTDFLEI